MPLASKLLLGFSLALLAGCGNSRTPVPDATQPAAPQGFRTLTLSAAGVRLAAPVNWTVAGQRAPLLLTAGSGTALVALWRYARTAGAPAGRSGLRRARRALIAAVRARDRTLQLLGSSLTRVDGARAIELTAIERIAGAVRQVISTHVYVRGAELVLDEYAPPAQFAAVNRAVFSPVRHSLALLSPGTA
jgi:hypothetical protein